MHTIHKLWYSRHTFHRRRAMILVAFAGLASAFIVLRPDRIIRARAPVLWTQHRAATYNRPADQVVYEESPRGIASLRARSAEYREVEFADGTRSGGVYIPYLDATAGGNGSLHVLQGSGGVYIPYLDATPAPIGHFSKEASAVFESGWPTHIFLHQLTSHGGSPRLVDLDLMISIFPQSRRRLNFFLRTKTFVPWLDGDGEEKGVVIYWTELGPNDELRMYAGQPDTLKSRFSVKYVLNGQVGMLTGRLDDSCIPHLYVSSGAMKLSPAETLAEQ